MKCTVIGIAGGTGSGKSTFTNRLKQEFKDDITVLYHDNYYRSRDDISLDDRKKINYDHPDSLETDLLIEHICRLKQGECVHGPQYNYTLHTRMSESLLIYPSSIIIVEGILVLQNEALRKLMDIKIYVEADADERILRRILRDVEERGRDINDVTKQYLSTVKPMHYMFVEPTKAMADIVINSGKNDVAYDIIKNKLSLLLDREGK